MRPSTKRALASITVAVLMLASLAGIVSAQTTERVYSEWSETASVTTLAEPEPEPTEEPDPDPLVLASPGNVQASAASHEVIDLSWDAVVDATGYEAECGTQTTDTVETSTSFSGLEPETSYDCRVRAYADVESEPNPDPTQEPDPDPVAGSWDQSWASGDLVTHGVWFAENTGPKKDDPTLTQHSGSITSTQDGQVIEDVYVQNGTINIAHDNVTVRNAYIEYPACGACYGIQYSPVWGNASTGAVVENVTLEGPRTAEGPTYAILLYSEGSQTVRNVQILGHNSGVGLFGSGHVLEYVWAHDNHYEDGLHSSAVAVRADNVEVSRSFLNGGATAPFFVYGTYTNILVQETLFHEPGSSYCSGWGSHESATFVRSIGNAFGECGFGTHTFWNGSLEGNEWSDNFWFATGDPVS